MKNGPAGGDNIFLIRPLNEQSYAKAAEFACGKLKLHKLGLSLVSTALGTTAEQAIRSAAKSYPNCKVVTAQYNGATATDLTQQVLAFKDAGVDGVISANFPAPVATQVNQMRQNGIDVPYISSTVLNIAKDSGSITTGLDNLYVFDDCTPDLVRNKTGKRFTKEYVDAYGVLPNYAAAEVYDMFHIAADVVDRAGHDHAKINKAMLSVVHDGICSYKMDKNNVLATSQTVFKYGPDGKKQFVATYPLDYVPSDDLASTTTTTTTTTAAG